MDLSFVTVTTLPSAPRWVEEKAMIGCVDVPEHRPGRRRRFSPAEKLAILSELDQ